MKTRLLSLALFAASFSPLAAQAQERSTVCPALQRDFKAGEGRVHVHAGGPEGIGRCQTHLQAGRFGRGNVGDLDFGPQGLANGRQDLKSPQIQGHHG